MTFKRAVAFWSFCRLLGWPGYTGPPFHLKHLDVFMDLEKLTSLSRWRLKTFGGKVQIEGRILSVSEAETSGLASGLLLATMASPEILAKTASLKSEEEKTAAIIRMSKNISTAQISKLNEANDAIICKVVKLASLDNGENWSKIQIVQAEEQQDHTQNKLWVGVFNEKDRDAILDKALEGHKEAVTRIATFPER
jgi:hypothetical protein